jgi:hypothetical protein
MVGTPVLWVLNPLSRPMATMSPSDGRTIVATAVTVRRSCAFYPHECMRRFLLHVWSAGPLQAALLTLFKRLRGPAILASLQKPYRGHSGYFGNLGCGKW